MTVMLPPASLGVSSALTPVGCCAYTCAVQSTSMMQVKKYLIRYLPMGRLFFDEFDIGARDNGAITIVKFDFEYAYMGFGFDCLQFGW